MRNTTVQHTAYADCIAEHQCHDLQADNRVEGDTASDVDESQQTSDQTGDGDGIGRYVHGGVDLADPGVEWKSLITSKCESLACG